MRSKENTNGQLAMSQDKARQATHKGEQFHAENIQMDAPNKEEILSMQESPPPLLLPQRILYSHNVFHETEILPPMIKP